jgi:hypothetical protein
MRRNGRHAPIADIRVTTRLGPGGPDLDGSRARITNCDHLDGDSRAATSAAAIAPGDGAGPRPPSAAMTMTLPPGRHNGPLNSCSPSPGPHIVWARAICDGLLPRARQYAGEESAARSAATNCAPAADNLGLTKEVYKQMSGRCKVSRQTEIIIDQLEELQLRSRKRQAEPPKGKPARRRRDLARYLYPTPRRGKRE